MSQLRVHSANSVPIGKWEDGLASTGADAVDKVPVNDVSLPIASGIVPVRLKWLWLKRKWWNHREACDDVIAPRKLRVLKNAFFLLRFCPVLHNP